MYAVILYFAHTHLDCSWRSIACVKVPCNSVLQAVLCCTFGSQRIYPNVIQDCPRHQSASLLGIACAGTTVPSIRAPVLSDA